MAPAFKQAATELKGKAVLADVDATVEKELAEQYGIRGFPTLKLFSKGEVLSEYKGGRSKEDLVKYIERAMLPSIVECASESAVTEFIKENSGRAIFFGAKLDKHAAAYKKLSMSIRDLIPEAIAFGSVADVSLLKSAASADVPEGSVLLIRDDGTTEIFTGTEEELESWIKLGAVPLFAELKRSNANVYTELQKPIFLLFQNPKKKFEQAMKDITNLSGDLRSRGALAFAWLDSVDLKSFAEHIGVTKEPGIAIYNFEDDSKYLFNEAYSADGVRQWVTKFVDGKLEATIKSEPVPKENNEPVKIVVGDSWKDIVEDESKDVLIEQYAPWCGHCKKLAPTLDALAKDLASVKTLVIAKMDATQNDAPGEYKAKGFPTIHFFPAGQKKGISYEGGREKADFVRFFKENATFKEGLSSAETDTKSDEGEEKDDL